MAIPSAEARAVLDMLSNAGPANSPTLTNLSLPTIVAAARAMVVAVAEAQGPAQPLYAVEDHMFGGDIPSKMRLYRPGPGIPPVLLFFYGGGFISGGVDTYDTVLRVVAKRTGWAIAVPKYRLAPEHPYPAAPEDCYAALVDVAARASSLAIDNERIVVAGESAGGTLAAVVALMARDRQGPSLTGLVSMEPVSDFRPFTDPDARDAYPSLTENDGVIMSIGGLSQVADLYIPDPVQRLEPYASPGLAPDLEGLPPTLIVTAECDPLRDDGQMFAERLRLAGVVVEVICLEGAIHGVLANMNQVPDASERLMAHIQNFLRKLEGDR